MVRNVDCGVARLYAVLRLGASVLFTAMSFNVAATAQGLVAAYSFDQGAGTTLTDTSGNGNDGVISGATWTASGRFGGALSFDGVNDWVTVVDAASLDLTSAMTIEAWVYPTTVAGWRTVLMKEAGGAPPYTLYTSGQGTRPSAQINNGAGVPGVVGSSALALNAWSHLSATYDGSSLRLYVNGALIKSRALAGAIVVSNGSLRIGGNSVWGEYFQGRIDEVRIYNRALSAAEITSDINAPIGGAGDTQAPSAPTNLTATAVSSTQIDLSWTASTDDVAVTGYLVERCQGSSCTDFTQIGTPTTNSFSSTGLLANTTYRFRIRAHDAVPNDSGYSSIASAMTPAAADVQAPTAPTNLTATAGSSTQINLSWSASTDNVAVTGYLVERCEGASCTNFSQIATPTTTSYDDTGLTPSTPYRYRVRARDAVPNYSAYSAIVSSATSSAPDSQAPTTPTGLTVTAGTNQLALAWDASTDNVGVTAYLIERCAGSGCTYFQIASVATTFYSDTSVAVGTSYSYRVRARDAVPNYSDYSNVDTATPISTPTACDAGTPGTPATLETIGTPTGVSLTDGGFTATFTGSTPTAVRSTVAIEQGPNNFYYFEAKRQNTAVGVSGSTPQVGATTTDSVMSTRPGTWLGFAVDYRQKYPVLYVLTDTVTGSCTTASAAAPCVIDRVQMTGAPNNALSIYAYKAGGSTASVTINTGNDLVAKPFNLSQSGVRKALRAKWYRGDRGLNAQWPTSTGSVGTPSIARIGNDWAVLRQGDAASISAAACAASLNGSIKWVDQNGVERGTGDTLDLTPLTGTLGVGEHTLMATLTEPATNRYAETKFRFTVLGSGDDPDNDNDGLTYSQESGLTDPGNPDSDGDGLSDGVEAAYGFNPTLADTNGNGTRDGRELAGSPSLLEKLTLIAQSGASNATGSGVVISDDGFGAAFTSDLNQDCLQRKPPFDDPAFPPFNPAVPASRTEPCMKLAVRTSAGIKPGEFRYFETRRLFAPSNIGHGLITHGGRIDPYCCIVNLADPINPLTPPSMSVNSVNAGTWVQLRSTGAEAFTGSSKLSGATTEYYGFAVDYTGTNPIVYVVGRNSNGSGTMSVLRMPQLSGFNGGDVMPMLYGSRVSDTAVVSTINLGLQDFHYDTAAIQAALLALGNTNTAMFTPGVGVHRRPL